MARSLLTLPQLLQFAFLFHSSEYAFTEILAENIVCQWKMFVLILTYFLTKLLINTGRERLYLSYM